MNFPALMTAPPTPLLRVLSPNDGRRAFARTRTLLAVICVLALFTGGCNKSMKSGKVSLQRVCALEMVAGESGSLQEHDWNVDMQECVIILDTEE